MPARHYTSGLRRGRLSHAVSALAEALMLVGKLNLRGREISIKQCSQGELSVRFPLVSVLFCVQEGKFFQRINMRSLVSVENLNIEQPRIATNTSVSDSYISYSIYI